MTPATSRSADSCPAATVSRRGLLTASRATNGGNIKRVVRLLLVPLQYLAVPAAGEAQTKARDLSRVPIEDLMNIEITSVSHKEQRAGDVAAAVSVLTQEDIRQSGMTTLPELLRLVPGVQVAQINSNKWAVAVRGFNNLFADKLLVLIDGRTVYDRLNSGVFWESLDIPLEQIERIEVVRGPGGAAWGANAVNGVINIVTKSAADAQGAAFSVGTGSFDGDHGTARYGGRFGAVAYRVSSQWSGHDQSQIDANTPANDSWQSQNHGFRLDWSGGRDTLIVEGDATFGHLRALWRQPTGPVPAVRPLWTDWSSTSEYSVLSRWTHHRDNGAAFQLQSSLDFRRNQENVTNVNEVLSDIAAQYQTAVGRRHDLVLGVGSRVVQADVDGAFSFSISPDCVTETVVNVFAQDEIALGRRVKLTLGAKVERDSHVGWGIQPTARAMWTPEPHQRLWAAVSRAQRTPSLIDLSVRYNFTSFVGPGGLPVVVAGLGSTSFQSEQVTTTEAGYRYEFSPEASVDMTGFVGRYASLKTSEPLMPHIELSPAPVHLLVPVQFANLLDATAYGVEIDAHWTAASWWRLDGSYSTFHLTPHILAASGDTAAASFDGNAPRRQWQARSAFFLKGGVELNAQLFHSAALSNLHIDPYTRADARLRVPLMRRLSIAVVGQNLRQASHAEYAGAGAVVTSTLIPRSGSINRIWTARP